MRGRRGFSQYLILQVPDILLAGLVLLLLHRWDGLSLGWAIGLFALWLLKDLVLFRWLRDIFAPPRIGPETLVGARATTQEPLGPAGYVLIRGEIWRAESLRPHETIAPGTPVIVRAARGLTLFVETHESPAAQDGLQDTP